MSSKNNTMSATKSLFLLHIHVLWDAPIIFFQPLKLCNENTEQDPKGPRPDDGIKESIKAPVAMSWSRDLSNILFLLDVGEWFSGFRVLSVMFLHSPNLNEKVWKRSHYLVSLFSFFFFSCSMSVSFLSHLFVREGVQLWDDEVSGKGGCAIHYRRWKGADKSPYQPCLLPTELREQSKGEIHQPPQMGHDSEITLPLYKALYIPYTGFIIVS